MKKFLIPLLMLLSFGITFWENINTKNCKPTKFIVSGYYSPVKWQKYYYRGNYEDEVRLNWWGLRWASWKKVFNWMLAAPKSYSFGTTIYFPGYGIGEVSDRWWAIVKSGQRGNKYDRIDVWMWTWENGLKRALSFGKKEVSAYICDQDLEVGFDYSKFKIIDNFFGISLWSISLDAWREDPWVEVMQTYLSKLGYLNKKDISWEFDEKTENALCNFQVSKWIVEKNDETCGYFWPTTRRALKNTIINKWIFLAYDEGPRHSSEEIPTDEISQEVEEFMDIYESMTSEELYWSDQNDTQKQVDQSNDSTVVKTSKSSESTQVVSKQDTFSNLSGVSADIDMKAMEIIYQFQK